MKIFHEGMCTTKEGANEARGTVNQFTLMGSSRLRLFWPTCCLKWKGTTLLVGGRLTMASCLVVNDSFPAMPNMASHLSFPRSAPFLTWMVAGSPADHSKCPFAIQQACLTLGLCFKEVRDICMCKIELQNKLGVRRQLCARLFFELAENEMEVLELGLKL